MSTQNSEAASATTAKTSPPAPPPASSARLIVLLGLLGLAIGAFVYDYAGARPGVDAAEKKIGEFVDARNRMSVKDGGRVTPDDIHKELGMQPTWVDKHDADQYEVEYYCWWGPVPVFNMRRHYISIVYIGDEPRRFSSHYKNEVPPREALPILDPQPDPDPSAALDTPVAEGAGPGSSTAKDSEAAPAKDADSPSTEAPK
jgi:hypothetical protein